ncbi:hypothetical protein FB451DRAFT_1350544 [Mycena latifolia]|nr:hypothetical protein FB451DRAFT_1350544 [Mycena latifolia]
MASTGDRERIARDTIHRTPQIIADCIDQGASSESTFFQDQLPALDPLAKNTPELLTVINSDSFTAARNIIAENADAQGKMAVLNLASDEEPAGGWINSFTRTQRRCAILLLFMRLSSRSTTPGPTSVLGLSLACSLQAVVVFKDDLGHECADLAAEDRCIVSIITVAAPRLPELTPDQSAFKNPSDLEDLRGKIRLMINTRPHDQTAAMGCGAYLCPPKLVASEMKSILLEEEFKGRFKRIVFAIYSSKPTGPTGNLEIFRQVFDGVKVG